MKGVFKLYYREGQTNHPCVGVNYKVFGPGDVVVASGKTDATGQTAFFDGAEQPQTYELKVLRGGRIRWRDPDTYPGPDSSTSLHLSGIGKSGVTCQVVHVVPYFKVRFLAHPNRRPIAKAKFTAYALDANGKEAIARDVISNHPIRGETDSQGSTGEIKCVNRLVFKFEVPGTSAKVESDRLEPILPGQDNWDYEVPFKTVRAMTGEEQGTNAQLAGKISAPILVSPQDEELIMIPQEDYKEFEEFSGRLDKIIGAMHMAKLDLSRALESKSESEVAAAEKALGLAEDKVKSELNKNFAKLADLKEVITFEVYNKGPNSKTGGSQFGLRRRYLKTDKYLQLKNKRINEKEYKLAVKFTGSAGTSGSVEIKTKSIDAEALKESISKISTSVKSSKKVELDPAVWNVFDVAGNQYAETLKKSESYQVDAQAQWFRLVGGGGASAEIDWSKRQAQIQGNLQGKIVLCEGKITGQWAVPSLKGWMMSIGDEDLGAIRFVMELTAYGFAGAKIVATGAVGISSEGGKQIARAIKADGQQSLASNFDSKLGLPRFEAAGPYEAMPKDLNGVKADIDAFAGVEAGLTPAGKMQWLPPREKEFVSFAEVSGTAAVSAGAGLQCSLAIYFANGKFRVRAAARLCWGVGCKGAVEFTVDASKVLEFTKWVAYQLAHAGFTKLVYFAKDAFVMYSQLLLLCVSKDSPTYAEIERISKDIDGEFNQLLTNLKIVQERESLVNNINRNPDWLVYATPETRGMLLYAITRHRLATHSRDLPTVGGTIADPEVHYLPSHKQAIINIMAPVVLANEWDNVMQHMTIRGLKSDQSSGRNEGDVMRFLNNGVSLAELPSVFEALNRTGPVFTAVSDKKGSGNEFLDKYLKMRGVLKGHFPKGRQIVRTDSPEFELMPSDGRPHYEFAQIETRGIGEAYEGDPGSSTA